MISLILKLFFLNIRKYIPMQFFFDNRNIGAFYRKYLFVHRVFIYLLDLALN